MEKYKNYIGGEWVSSITQEEIQVLNPANGDVLGYVPKAGAKETTEAIEAAHNALDEWASLPAQVRAKHLKKWYELMVQHQEDIARTLTLEQGKPFPEALGEVKAAALFVEWYAEEAKRIYGEVIPASTNRKRIVVIKQPVGVVAAITPWNFPASMVTRKIAPALAAGCPVILKPATQTPLTALKIIELADKAGLPKGVINMVTGGAEAIGKTLMEDKRVSKVTFTGSTEVGKLLIKQSADTVKRVSLELGGHAPYIVFDDANIDKAVAEVMDSKIRNCGQMCVATNRFYVQEDVVDAFVDKLKERFSSFIIGNGIEDGVHIGPLIDRKAYEKVENHIQDAVSKGAEIVFGGKGYHEGDHQDSGYFYQPTVLINVTDDMLVMHEETFGPVLPIKSFKTEDEVIKAANNTDYGLAVYLFTESLSRGIQVSEKLQYGIVGLNDGGPATVQAPFGGFKESGIGREGGHHGLDPFLEIKYISIGV
ncbi:succinate semialdehyde dehydrogenase [Natronincola peptidivorans]|uniref:Succinate semialdehyde dehydrogenase n=1 Tax=Natronincola peptidivorans TaxID=426128 RepID=A0A1I0BJM4_9FIRM|nr:NAD-dependent succinate-semialdehyde dehydrogenase [Natronincola peptidivorans]SET07121.1 succinate semialdehyde dehydrogenase [Natronincola peptidivorans]